LDYPVRLVSFSEEDTSLIAKEFSGTLKGGEVIILNGNLGAGKTFFIKRAGLEFNIHTVNSPTFAIVNEYYGTKKINHFDFYRINTAQELYAIGLDDYLNEENSITFIEWGNLFPEVLPHKRIEVNILINEDYSREFFFEIYGN